jgi:hypothetical protein
LASTTKHANQTKSGSGSGPEAGRVKATDFADFTDAEGAKWEWEIPDTKNSTEAGQGNERGANKEDRTERCYRRRIVHGLSM